MRSALEAAARRTHASAITPTEPSLILGQRFLINRRVKQSALTNGL
jgi:hypothetical protein